MCLSLYVLLCLHYFNYIIIIYLNIYIVFLTTMDLNCFIDLRLHWSGNKSFQKDAIRDIDS